MKEPTISWIKVSHIEYKKTFLYNNNKKKVNDIHTMKCKGDISISSTQLVYIYLP